MQYFYKGHDLFEVLNVFLLKNEHLFDIPDVPCSFKVFKLQSNQLIALFFS